MPACTELVACIARKKQVNVSVILLYLLFQEKNHLVPVPFVFVLCCKKPCREQFIFSGTPDDRQPADNGKRTTEGNGADKSHDMDSRNGHCYANQVLMWIHANHSWQSC
jgi:hypothetical protein